MNGSTQQILIQWPQKALFNYICDIENYAEWQQSVYSAEWITRERHDVGARFVETRFVNGRREEAFAEIRENVPHTRRTISFRNGRIQTLYTYEFEAVGDSTLLRIRVEVKAPELLAWTENFMVDRICKEKTEELLRLKQMLESEAEDMFDAESLLNESKKN